MCFINKKIIFAAVMFFTFIAFIGCQNTQLAEESVSSASGDAAAAQAAAQGAQSSADAAMTRANEAFQQAGTARRIAERAVEMANQNQAALRALNDKIDRMFETISRK
ncbi:MAG: hypothetical protein CFH32_00466 [Alphaproteobacteria bacterium MarineAlpha9_Bin2]|nr:MAG: hypothetical protein CFH32_00466 [Alphaproteobacteria bacterium MarineAlpha9_Bin2]